MPHNGQPGFGANIAMGEAKQAKIAFFGESMTLHVQDAFQHFRDQLDEHYGRRERLIKVILCIRCLPKYAYRIQASRDITDISKKTIFLIHRLAMAQDESARSNAAQAGFDKLGQVQEMYAEMKNELIGDQFWSW